MTSLQEALRSYLRVERSSFTNHNYEVHLSRMIRAIGPERDVGRVTHDDLADYVDRLRNGPRSLKATTLRSYVGLWTSFFNWCVDEGFISRSPTRHLRVSGPQQEPVDRAVPPDVLSEMVQAARYHPRDYALLLFMIDTGARVGGVESLTIQRLNLDAGTAVLLEKGSKWHTVYFGEVTATALRAWLEKRAPAGHDRVFTTNGPAARPLSRRGISKVVSRYARRAGADKLWSGHAIRHAVGHAYADADVPVHVTQKKLGHARPDTTGTYYPDEQERLREMARAMPLAPLRQAAPAAKVIRVKDWSA